MYTMWLKHLGNSMFFAFWMNYIHLYTISGRIMYMQILGEDVSACMCLYYDTQTKALF